MAFNYVGATIYGPAAPPAVFTDLDVSSHVGAQRVWVYLKITPATTDFNRDYLSFKPKGDPGQWAATFGAFNNVGTGIVNANDSTMVYRCAVPTSTAGVLQWAEYVLSAGPPTDVTVELWGYDDDVDWLDAAFHSGAMPMFFTTKDISGQIGSVAALPILRLEGGVDSFGDLVSFEPQETTRDLTVGAAPAQLTMVENDVQLALMVTDSSGQFKWESTSSVGSVDGTVLGVINGTRLRETVFDDPGNPGNPDTPPTTDTLLDLSSYVGASRQTVLLELETDSGTFIDRYYSFQPSDDSDEHMQASYQAAGLSSASMYPIQNAYFLTQTGPDGKVLWKASDAGIDVKVDLLWYSSGTTSAPTFSNKTPTGGAEQPDVDVSFTVDDDAQVIEETIQAAFTGPGPVTYQAIVDGVFQPGFGGTITPNGNGFDVEITTHPLFDEGSWQIDVEAEDDGALVGTDSWSFTTEWIPVVVRVSAEQRRIVRVVWSLPVRCRDLSVTPVDGADRYTPVDWTGIGGQVDDAQNPAHYSIVRPPGGNLSGLAEGIDLVPVRVDETDGRWYDVGTVRYAWAVDVKTDYDHTARADYEITVGQVASPGQDSVQATEGFLGYVASQVPRFTLTLIEQLPGIVRRLDDEGTGDLARFFTALQETFDRVLEDIDAFFPDLCEIDRARPEFLNAILYDLGDPLGHLFNLTINEKRKLASVLVQMYREKGTCEGVVNVVRLFTGVELVGCSRAWADVWRLHGGSYPSTVVPYGGPYLLGTNTKIGPGTGAAVRSFWLLHPSPASLTADELDKIAAIVDYMKPAAMHYLGVRTP